MNKQELLAFIQSLPDDLCVRPVEYVEGGEREQPWESTGQTGIFGGVYRRDIHNTMTLVLDFRTSFEGQFRRTYERPDGIWFGMHRAR